MSTHEGSRHAPLRDVLAGLYNLETLLRSPRAANDLILGVLPELERGAYTLLAAFEEPSTDPANVALSDFARARVETLCAALREVPPVLHPRARLALLAKVIATRPDLALAVDLLSILEISRAPETTDLDLGEACRVAFAKNADTRLRDVHVSTASGSIVHDARILTFLLREGAIESRASQPLSVTVAPQPDHDGATFRFSSAGAMVPSADPSGAETLRSAIFRAVLARLRGELQSGALSVPAMER